MIDINTLVVTPFAQNARLLVHVPSKEAVVIDPGGEAERILALAESKGARVNQIWLTHSHVDHVGAVAAVVRATAARVYAHPGEREMRARVLDICRMYGLPTGDIEPAPEPDYPLLGGESLALGPERFVVYHTPGHSPGHLSFYQPESEVLIAGDLLFQGSVGRTDLPGGNHEVLLKSIAMLMRELPPATRVLSGHGPDTTLGEEERSNPFLVGLR